MWTSLQNEETQSVFFVKHVQPNYVADRVQENHITIASGQTRIQAIYRTLPIKIYLTQATEELWLCLHLVFFLLVVPVWAHSCVISTHVRTRIRARFHHTRLALHSQKFPEAVLFFVPTRNVQESKNWVQTNRNYAVLLLLNLAVLFRWFEEVARFGSFWKKQAKSEQAKSNHLQAAFTKSMCTPVSWSRWGLILDFFGLFQFNLGWG